MGKNMSKYYLSGQNSYCTNIMDNATVLEPHSLDIRTISIDQSLRWCPLGRFMSGKVDYFLVQGTACKSSYVCFLHETLMKDTVCLFNTGGLSRQFQFAWIIIVERIFR